MGKRPGTTGPMPRKLRPNASPHAEKHRTSGKISSKTVNFAANANDHEYRSKPKDRVGRRNRRSTLGHTARRAEDRRRPRELRLPHVAVRAAQLRGQRRRRRRGGTRTPQPAPRKKGGTYAGNGAVPDRDGRSHARRGGHPQLRDPAGRSLGQHPVHPADRGARPAHPCSLLRVAGTAQPRIAPHDRAFPGNDARRRGTTSTRSRWSKSRCESATS